MDLNVISMARIAKSTITDVFKEFLEDEKKAFGVENASKIFRSDRASARSSQ
jgi:hypothetical protein